jgi:hypothetical protein
MCRGLAEELHYHTYISDSTRQSFTSYVTLLVKNFTAFYGTDLLLQFCSLSTTCTRHTQIQSAHPNPVSWISTLISSSLPPGFRGSSVGIPTRYGWTVRGSNPGWGARCSARVQTGPGAHSASCTIGTVSFPGSKRSRRGTDHPPHLAPRLNKE